MGIRMSNDVDIKIASLANWRGALLTRVRGLIKHMVPDVIEDVKWRKPKNPLGVSTWSHADIICTGESHKNKIKLTFLKGSLLNDPNGLFNASLTGMRRAIDIYVLDDLNETALKALFKEAAASNASGNKR